MTRHRCIRCGTVELPEPGLACYACRRKVPRPVPLGEPCPGCGEACERCLEVEE